jgi:molybdenum cofactor biosynthesis protein MoaC
MDRKTSASGANTALHRQFGMADVSAKPITRRVALASGRISLGPQAFEAVATGKLPKGDALAMAEIAGIQGAKATPSLLPLCHPISLSRASIHTHLDAEHNAVVVYCLCEIAERTGVEMEALNGVSIALLNIWDLSKPLNAALEIGPVRLLFKAGGKHGEWTHPDGLDARASAIIDACRLAG